MKTGKTVYYRLSEYIKYSYAIRLLKKEITEEKLRELLGDDYWKWYNKYYEPIKQIKYDYDRLRDISDYTYLLGDAYKQLTKDLDILAENIEQKVIYEDAIDEEYYLDEEGEWYFELSTTGEQVLQQDLGFNYRNIENELQVTQLADWGIKTGTGLIEEANRNIDALSNLWFDTTREIEDNKYLITVGESMINSSIKIKNDQKVRRTKDIFNALVVQIINF